MIEAPRSQLHEQHFDTTLGAAWHLLNPLMNAAIFYVVFGILFGARLEVTDYAAFLLVGVFVFTYSMRSIQSGSSAIVSNLRLISEINFPRAALPLSTTVAETVTHLFSLAALLPFLILLGERPHLDWLLVVPLLVLQAVFNLGAILVVARVTFHFRDLQNFLPYVLRMWMYASGVFFTVDFVIDQVGADSPLVTVFELNPAYVFVHLNQAILIDSHAAAPGAWWLAAMWSVVSATVGFFYFRRREVEYGRG